MNWKVSPLLVPVIDEVRQHYPEIVIGTIGDAAHQQEVSDHNPDQWGYVCAADFMIADHGFNWDACQGFVNRIVQRRDTRMAYLIFNRHFMSATIDGWHWRTYDGSDPHTNHAHLSVIHGPNPHPTTSWHLFDQEPAIGYGWYHVVAGDNPKMIAAMYDITVDQFYEWNSRDALKIGEWVKVRGGSNPLTGYKG